MSVKGKESKLKRHLGCICMTGARDQAELA